MKIQQRRRLLNAVCTHLPADEAERILAGSRDDYGTYVKAYLAARRAGTVPNGLKRALLAIIFDMMDAETARTLRERSTVRGT